MKTLTKRTFNEYLQLFPNTSSNYFERSTYITINIIFKVIVNGS